MRVTPAGEVLRVESIERLNRADLIKLINAAGVQPIADITRDGDEVWLNAADLAAFAALKSAMAEYFADFKKYDLDLPGAIDVPSAEELALQLTKVREEGGVFGFKPATDRAIDLAHAFVADYCGTDIDEEGVETDEDEESAYL